LNNKVKKDKERLARKRLINKLYLKLSVRVRVTVPRGHKKRKDWNAARKECCFSRIVFNYTARKLQKTLLKSSQISELRTSSTDFEIYR
jgi:hypothetical protein